MKEKKHILGILLLITALLLAACGDNSQSDTEKPEENQENTSEESASQSQENMQQHMSSSGEVPDDLEVAKDPTYEVGSNAIITAVHMNMEAMSGAEATIVGAYDTTAYEVSYTPTNGGEAVENHKWVIHEELERPGEAPLEPGTKVIMNADHMKGMDGAEAVIDSAEDTTVYMVDFAPSDGEEVVNHKWVIESELEPAE